MLKEHQMGLVKGEDLGKITRELEQEERDRHQLICKQIENSAAEAKLFSHCLKDPEAQEAAVIVRAYIKAWAAKYGIDLDELRRQQEERDRLPAELLKEATR